MNDVALTREDLDEALAAIGRHPGRDGPVPVPRSAYEKQSQLAVWAGLARGAEDYELLVGHLPGRHDQLTHGSWASLPTFDLSGSDNADLTLAEVGEGWTATVSVSEDLQEISANLMNDPESFDPNDVDQAAAALLLNKLSEEGVSGTTYYSGLYRGMNVDEATAQQLRELAPGTQFALPLSSFSEKIEIGRYFSRGNDVPVLIRAGNAPGVSLRQYAGDSMTRNEAEVVSAGDFVVKSVGEGNEHYPGGPKVVELEITGVS